jgi:hypothetical protein
MIKNEEYNNPELSNVTNAISNTCVKKSVGYDMEAAEKYSIVPCAQNSYLREDYDPFEQLRIDLLMMSLEKTYLGSPADPRTRV